MNPQPLGHQDRGDALVIAALLGASLRTLGAWSQCLSLLALVAGLMGQASLAATSLWTLVLLIGLVERYVAFRLALDERLFDQLGHGDMPSLHALDRSLSRLGLRAGSAKPERPWSERLRGTLKLLHRYFFLVLLQTASALGSLFF